MAISAEAGAKLQIGLRFFHVLAGILWVGLLYFFNLVNLRFLRELDAATRLRIYARLMRPTLWWFRWASVVTVLAGIWYWMIIVGEDKASALAVGIVPHPGPGNRQLLRHLDGGLFRHDRHLQDGQAQRAKARCSPSSLPCWSRPPPGFTFP